LEHFFWMIPFLINTRHQSFLWKSRDDSKDRARNNFPFLAESVRYAN